MDCRSEGTAETVPELNGMGSEKRARKINSEKIKKIISDQGKTINEVSKAIGYAQPPTFRRVLRKKEMPLDRLITLESYLNVPAEELLKNLEMPEFDSNQCVSKLSQGCTYVSGKCPCRLKKTRAEEEHEQREHYVKTHWKAVVLCKECKYRIEMNLKQPDGKWSLCEAWEQRICDLDGWCYMGEKKWHI